MSQVDLGAELIHGDATSLYRLAEEKGWEMEELISLAQGDGGPLPAEGNDGFGLFYVGGEKRMLAMDSKVQQATFLRLEQFQQYAYMYIDDNSRCCAPQETARMVGSEIGLVGV